MIIPRDKYLNLLISAKKNGFIKIVTGIRRAEKSFLLFNLFVEHLKAESVSLENIIMISLEDLQSARYRDPFKFDSFVRDKITTKEQYFLLVDEIQNIATIKNPWIKGEKLDFVDVLLGFTNATILFI